MNHITRLQAENAMHNAHLSAYAQGIIDLKAYLTSDKFSSDPTVQVADVMRRLSEITSNACDEAFAAYGQAVADSRKGAK